MTKAVVFDLDGTLAKTADLVDGDRRREPAHVLALSPPGDGARNLRLDDQQERIPGDLAALGYRVAIVTASPLAYASTLADLLNIDFERLLASPHGSKAKNLRDLADSWGIDPIDMRYVGDRYQGPNSDKSAADEAGCEFFPADEIADLRQLPRITTNTSGRGTGTETNVPTDSPSSIKCRQCGLKTPLRLARQRVRLKMGCAICNRPFKLPRGSGGAAPVRILTPDIAAAAFRDLKEFPGREDRAELQRRFLDNVPPEARDCVLVLNPDEGLFQFPPWLVSKTELLANLDLRRLAMKTAAQLFPKSGLPMGAVFVDSLVPYWSKYGELLGILKDWKMHRGSGREVRQSLGYFIAFALAGHLEPVVKRADRQILLVPMPSRPCTEEQPGEFSLRLATRVAHLLDVELAPLLVHGRAHSNISMGDDFQRWKQMGLPVVVVDDQYTTGRSMKDALSLLDYHGFKVETAITWSRKEREGIPNVDSSRCFLRHRLGPSWNDCFCPHVS